MYNYNYITFKPHQYYSYKLITPAANVLLTAQQVKDHLRIDTDVEDDYIADLIAVAVDQAEKYTKRDFLTKTYKTWRNNFFNPIELRRSPLGSITSIKYYDASSVLQTLATDRYLITDESDFSIIYETPGTTFPTVCIRRPQAVEIQFTAGYGTDPEDVPVGIRHAVLLIASSLYENRGDCGEGGASDCSSCSVAIPAEAKSLLNMYRIKDLSGHALQGRF